MIAYARGRAHYDMKNKSILKRLVTFIVLVILLSTPTCLTGSNNGELPIYKIDDEWVYIITVGGETIELTTTIAGTETVDGHECYIVEGTLSPPILVGYDSMRSWIAKSDPTLSILRTELMGIHEGTSIIISTVTSIDYPDGAPWPLEIDNTFTLVKRITSSVTYGEDTQTDPEILETSHWVVEGKEDVTVPAGVFDCYKLSQYTEDNALQSRRWYSNDIKNDVKREQPFDEIVKFQELESHSLA